MKNAIRDFLSRPWTQPVWLQLLKLCHAGLNYGGGQTVAHSGETDALRFLGERTDSSKTFVLFDVGANDGEYLSTALRILKGPVQAYSFEPQSASFAQLQARLANDPRVRFEKRALGKESGSARLHFDADHTTTASLNASFHNGADSEIVELSTVDEFCRKNGIESIDLLKIDTEGHEMDVLQGASAMLKSEGIASIQFEFGDTFVITPYHFYDFWELLSPQYQIHRILRHGLARITRYSTDLEVYKTVNYLCIRNP